MVDGDSLLVQFSASNVYLFFVTIDSKIGNPEITKRILGNEISAGTNGISGINAVDIEQPVPPDPVNPAISINSYKSFVRSNIGNNAQSGDLLRILKDIEGNKNVRSKYDVLGFVNDLESLENQYYQLRDEVNFVPYIKSLANRISDYAKLHKENENQKILRFVYSATLSKLHSISNRTKPISIVDLNEYLEVVQNHIQKLREADSKAMIAEYQNAYQAFLYSRIETGARIIEKEILPDIKTTFVELDDYIAKLIIQTQQRQKSSVARIKGIYSDKEKIERSVVLRQALMPLKVVATIATVFSPIVKGLAVGVLKIIDSAFDDKSSKANVTVPVNDPQFRTSGKK